MTPISSLTIILRVAAILMLLMVAADLFTAWVHLEALEQGYDGRVLMLFAIPLVAVIVLIFPQTIAAWLLKGAVSVDNGDSVFTGENHVVLLMVVLVAVGLWMVCQALVDGTYQLFVFVIYAADGYGWMEMTAHDRASAWSIGVQLIIGLMLIFSRNGLARVLSWVRQAGLRAK